MSLYRCAASGSPNVQRDTQAGGIKYNYKKGLVGAAVFGEAGAVAGIENKREDVFVCPDCGARLTHSMPIEMKNMIDMGVRSVNARKSLRYMGIPLEWSQIKGMFKNIESGIGDDLEASRKKLEGLRSSNVVEQLNEDRTKESRALKAAKRDIVIQKVIDELSDYQIAEMNRQQDLKKNLDDCANARKQIADKQNMCKVELSKLGVFSFSRKKELKNQIVILEEQVKAADKKYDDARRAFEKKKETWEVDKDKMAIIMKNAVDHYGPMILDEVTRLEFLIID